MCMWYSRIYTITTKFSFSSS